VSELPFVSVVVPTVPGRAVLRECLDSLRAQTYPEHRREVVVITDDLRAGAGATRNKGMAQTSSDLVCFLDDDALAPPGWLSAMMEGAGRHPGAGLLGGGVRPRFEAPVPRTCERHELAGATLDEGRHDIDTDEIWGCNMAVRRTTFDRLGGFDERLPLSEDWDFGRRVVESGSRIVYLPDAWIEHRRLADDLRLRSMPLEHLRRGWTVGMRLDPPPQPGSAARDARRWLGHAARTRCTRGLTEAAKATGLALAGLARLRRSR
jgi:GT2 family glycosyltransferase